MKILYVYYIPNSESVNFKTALASKRKKVYTVYQSLQQKE